VDGVGEAHALHAVRAGGEQRRAVQHRLREVLEHARVPGAPGEVELDDLGVAEDGGVELARPPHDPDAHLRGVVRPRTIRATIETRLDDARTRGVARAADPRSAS
jgi:hypothetical protein